MEENDNAEHIQRIPQDFSKIRIGGMKTLDDAIADIKTFEKINSRLGNKEKVLRAISTGKVEEMRQISDFFYKTSGIYNRLCRYLAYLYRYDWMITPYINGGAELTSDTELKDTEKKRYTTTFFQTLKYLDDFEVKRFCGDVALKVIKYGCYYGYIVPNGSTVAVQELPVKYCRSRFSVNKRPAVEFNMRFFDEYYTDSEQRARVLKLFPGEFKKGYRAYKEGRLKGDFQGDTSGWWLLEINNTIKFNINGDDFPCFISVIPAIIDLDLATGLDQKRMAQKLLRIVIQKMPLDKNGEILFDPDEVKELHRNAVQMLSRAIGVDVLTTFADVNVADMSDKSNTSQTDDLQRVERQVFNQAGVPQSLFNSDSNLAIQNSILNDEATLYNLIQQFEAFLNLLLTPFNKNTKKVYYRAQMLTTTIYNYKDMAKLYKEQTQMGYSKMLPQIALGQSQSSILANASWENDVLDLINVFIPPLQSSVMNMDALNKSKSTNGQAAEESDAKVGRPEKDDTQKSDKTIANRESM